MKTNIESSCFCKSRNDNVNVLFTNIRYIFCSENGKIIIDLNDGINYLRKQLNFIIYKDYDYFKNFEFEIYEHKKHGKIIAKKNSAPGKEYYKGTLIDCLLKIKLENWWNCSDSQNNFIYVENSENIKYMIKF